MRQRLSFVQRLAIGCRCGLILAVMLAVAAPLTADWLALRDGTQMEIDGAWRVDDGQVRFKLRNRAGLFSLPGDKVDLAASAELTRERREQLARESAATPPAAPPRRAPVLVLTDGDVRKVTRQPEPEPQERPEPAPAAGEEEAAPRRQVESGLELVSWRQSRLEVTGAVVIEGELRNVSRGLAIGLELTVALTDGEGGVVASRPALLSATTLAPRQRSRFRVEFPDGVEFTGVEFEMAPRTVASIRILGPHAAPTVIGAAAGTLAASAL